MLRRTRSLAAGHNEHSCSAAPMLGTHGPTAGTGRAPGSIWHAERRDRSPAARCLRAGLAIRTTRISTALSAISGPGSYFDPFAPYGRHPVTGQPFSDKSKTVAGLLQLLGLFGIAGIGRIYLGHTGLGIAQLLVGWVTCGLGAVIWGVIDALLILTDKVGDPWGRPLRDGS